MGLGHEQSLVFSHDRASQKELLLLLGYDAGRLESCRLIRQRIFLALLKNESFVLMLLCEKEVLYSNLEIISVRIRLQALLLLQATLVLPSHNTVLLAQFTEISLDLREALQALATCVNDLAPNREEKVDLVHIELDGGVLEVGPVGHF